MKVWEFLSVISFYIILSQSVEYVQIFVHFFENHNFCSIALFTFYWLRSLPFFILILSVTTVVNIHFDALHSQEIHCYMDKFHIQNLINGWFLPTIQYCNIGPFQILYLKNNLFVKGLWINFRIGVQFSELSYFIFSIVHWLFGKLSDQTPPNPTGHLLGTQKLSNLIL